MTQFILHYPLLQENWRKDHSTELRTFHLHLTYRCNLSCSYCYNKPIRANNQNELSLHEWKKIVDKIAPSASLIILTGGEFFLYKELLPLLKYIKEKMPKVTLSCISNCMHDFSHGNIHQALDYLDDITFSCDSMSEEGERIGFKPENFRKNIEYIRANFPKIKITISKTDTISSTKDTEVIKNFCTASKCDLVNITLNPTNYSDIGIMPPLTDDFDNDTTSAPNSFSKLREKNARCGAAKTTCSIDPAGNVYPCQSLHFKEFLMGNLLRQEIKELRYQDKEECIPCVDEIPECTKCKVKYICGGGCFASSYELRGMQLGTNKWLCPYNYNIAIRKLLHIKNNPLREEN